MIKENEVAPSDLKMRLECWQRRLHVTLCYCVGKTHPQNPKKTLNTTKTLHPTKPHPPTRVQVACCVVSLELFDAAVGHAAAVLFTPCHLKGTKPGEHNVGDILHTGVALDDLDVGGGRRRVGAGEEKKSRVW